MAKTENSPLKTTITRLIRVQLLLAVFFVANILIADAWNLIAAEALWARWIMAAVLLVVTVGVWYLAQNVVRPVYHKLLFFALMVTDIAFVTFNVYSQRGLASRAVALYAIPIVLSAALLNRSAVYFSATLCTTAYALATIHYFVMHPGESYKIELYSEVGFYCAAFFVLAGLLSVVIRAKNK